MTSDRLEIRVAVYVLCEKQGKLLYLRRYNTGWADGLLTIPAGHVDHGEFPTQAAVRELREETGIVCVEDDLELFHTFYELDNYIVFFYKLKELKQEPKLMEPDKSSELVWKDIEDFDEVLPKVKTAIEKGYIGDERYSQLERII